MSDSEDRIEREIEIDAPAERVWQLVSRPGWWVNDGEIVDHEIERIGDLDVVHDPRHGKFPIRTEHLDPPRYAAFRWMAGEPGDQSYEGASTLTEFWIADRGDRGVTLRVVESGFAALESSTEDRRRRLDENTEGWELELAAARASVEGE